MFSKYLALPTWICNSSRNNLELFIIVYTLDVVNVGLYIGHRVFFFFLKHSLFGGLYPTIGSYQRGCNFFLSGLCTLPAVKEVLLNLFFYFYFLCNWVWHVTVLLTFNRLRWKRS